MNNNEDYCYLLIHQIVNVLCYVLVYSSDYIIFKSGLRPEMCDV